MQISAITKKIINAFKYFLYSSIFVLNAYSAESNVPLNQCSVKELTAFSFFKSLEPNSRFYEEKQAANKQAKDFIESKKLKKSNKPIKDLLSVEDNLKLDKILYKIRAYETRDNIEKLYFRDKSVLIAMIGIVQDSNMDTKEFLEKNIQISALLVNLNMLWGDKENQLKEPYFINNDTKNCNIYTLSQQIIEEYFMQINATSEEIKKLTNEAPKIMEKVNKGKDGKELLTSEERIKYNKMKDVFPKLSKFRDVYAILERVMAVAYVADLRYQTAVEEWEKNLGDLSTINIALDKKFSNNQKYTNDFMVLRKYLLLFDNEFPYKELYEKASTNNPTNLFN